MQGVKKAKQLVVVADDRPGMLAEVAGVLAKGKINVEAISAYGIAGKAILYLVCAAAQKAKTALAGKGWQVKEEEVVVVALENKVGVLKGIADKLKTRKVNLLYCYGSTCDDGCGSKFVFKAEDNDLAIASLK